MCFGLRDGWVGVWSDVVVVGGRRWKFLEIDGEGGCGCGEGVEVFDFFLLFFFFGSEGYWWVGNRLFFFLLGLLGGYGGVGSHGLVVVFKYDR